MEENLVNVAPPETINPFESGTTKNQVFNVLPTTSNTMISGSNLSNNNCQLPNQQPMQMFQQVLLQNQGFKPGQTSTVMQDNSQQQMQQLFHQYLMLQAFQQSGLNMAANRNTFSTTTSSTTSITTTSINTFPTTLNPQLPTSTPIRTNNYNQSPLRMSMLPQHYLNNPNANNNALNNNILLTSLPFQQQQLSLLNQLAQQQKLQPVSTQNSINTSKPFTTPATNPILLGGFIPQGYTQQQPQSMMTLQQLQHLTSQQLKLQQILQQYQPTLSRANNFNNDNKDANNLANPSTTKSSSLLSSTFIDTSRNSVTPSNLPPSTQLPHTSSPSKNTAQNSSDQYNVNNLNNSLSSKFNDKFSLNNNDPGSQQNNQAMEDKQVATVKPYNIVTHIIEGFVIQEGPEPFPIQKSLSLNDYYKSDEEEKETEEDDEKSNCLTDDEDVDKMNGVDKMQANVIKDNSNKLVSVNNYENEASLNSDITKCVFCGCDFMPKNKTNKFCSISCNRKNAINKRWNGVSKGNLANKKSPQKRKSKKGKSMEIHQNFNDFQHNDQMLYYQQPNHLPLHQQQNMHLQSQQMPQHHFQSNHMQQNQPQQPYSFQQHYNVVTPDLHNQNYQYQNQNYQPQNVKQQQIPQHQHMGQQNHFQSDNIQLQNAYNVQQSQSYQQQQFQATHKYEEPDLVIIGDDKDLIFNKNHNNIKHPHNNRNNNMNNSMNNDYEQHKDNLSPNVSVTNTDVASWGVADVHSFISKLSGCASYADDFLRQEIDGQALMLLSEDLLMSTLHVKLGPALKICSNIRALRGQHGDNCGV